ncbi:MAG: hypothetical protein ABSB84_04560 [Verrucomicrobiota bacterium]|jgi:hypothetical protein
METLSQNGWGESRFHRLKLLLCGWAMMMTVRMALANTPITTDSPIGFFTNVASRLLSAELNMDLHRIQVYPTNQYTPAVHRLLQVTANIYDSTTNRFNDDYPHLPTVFRPQFGKIGDAVYITNFVEVTNISALTGTLRALTDTNSANALQPDDLVFGAPLIIGAKKGFPNFNEFYMESAFQLTRKLMVTRQSTNMPMPPPYPSSSFWGYYEMFNLSLSNHFGVECWNSYRSNYTRPIDIYVNDYLTMTLTNDENNFSFAANLSAPGFLQTNNWQGYIPGSLLAPLSFLTNFGAIPTNFAAVPVSIYRFNGGNPFLSADLALPFETNDTGFGIFPQPHWGLMVTNYVQVVMVDANSGGIIDYVLLNGPNSSRDLSAEIRRGYDTSAATNYHDLWDTNLIGGIPVGIANQYAISQGNGNPVWNSALWKIDQKTAFDEINAFRAFTIGPNFAEITYEGYVPDLNLIGAAMATNAMRMPYTPRALVVQDIVWQVNDPLVHYLASDLTDPTVGQGLRIYLNWPANLGQLNDRCRPWGATGDTNAYTTTIKDPLVYSSDNWDFPDSQPLAVSWLGRVHRGTPWQTIYLKASDVLSFTNIFGNYGTNLWIDRTGDTNPTDAAAMAPVQDWHLASLLAGLFNTNDLRSLFSVNNPNPDAWQALLEGLTALTNNLSDKSLTPPQFGVIVISSNSPQASVIANAIESARTAQPGQFFTDVGSILAIPQLTVNSPFLNWNDSVQQQKGISDEAYEIIPSQLLPLLRADSIGSVATASGQVVVQFTGYDGHSYAIEVSSNLVDWNRITTNCPVGGVFSFTNSPTLNASPQFYRSILLN